MQRSNTYDTFTEAYLSFRNPTLSQNLSLKLTRGIRGAESRSLRDGTSNPAYVVEWVGALQVDLIPEGVLNVKKEVLKKVQGLKKSYLKFYCTFGNLISKTF